MTGTIKIRIKQQDDFTLIRTLISHPMETGLRKDKETGKFIPAHFIRELLISLNDKTVASGMLGSAISKDPYFSIRIKKAKPGDTVTIHWVDNRGESDTASVLIK
ncbi:MAG: thiosulfate oxidation carrier complex protein SoxZ [Methylococcales bacterium]